MNAGDQPPPDIARFWGRLGHSKGAEGYHPLICNMIDVAALARALPTVAAVSNI